MKILLSVMSIVMVLSLSSCKETNDKPKTQNDPQTQTKETPAQKGVIAVDTPKAVENKEPVVKKIEKINIAPIEGGISIGDLFEKRDSYNGKVIQIKGKVVKFNKSIMGKNWVHLQDGTGKAGTKKTATNDLLVTTQEVVEVDDVVTFQGMIVLKKDFGAGYSYQVLMEMGKKQK